MVWQTHRVHCLTCGTSDHIHVPWTGANVLRVVGKALFVLITLPFLLVAFLLGLYRGYTPFALTRRCSGCGGLFVRGWIYESVKGECPKCRYDLTGNTTGRCPECGYEFDSRLLPNPPTEAPGQ